MGGKGNLAKHLSITPADKAAMARFQKRRKIDREFRKKIKKVTKELNIKI